MKSRRRRGTVMVMTAIALVFICGCTALAVDYGLLVNDKNKWQRGVDAASLAGAQELKKTGDETANTASARRVAIAVAAQNGVAVTAPEVTFLDDNTKIRVESANTRGLYFARVIGFQKGTVNAFAIAGITPAAYAAPKPVPISITYQTVLTRRTGYLSPVSAVDSSPVVLTTPRVQDSPYGLNEFLVFDLRSGGKSPTQMANQLIAGYENIAVGDSITSLNSSDDVIEKNFTPAIADRFKRSASAPWNDTWTGNVLTSAGIRYNEILAGTSPANNPRIISLIVNAPVGASNGTTNHLVLAFVPVYVESWQNNEMTIRFLPDSLFGGAGTGGSRAVSLLQ